MWHFQLSGQSWRRKLRQAMYESIHIFNYLAFLTIYICTQNWYTSTEDWLSTAIQDHAQGHMTSCKPYKSRSWAITKVVQSLWKDAECECLKNHIHYWFLLNDQMTTIVFLDYAMKLPQRLNDNVTTLLGGHPGVIPKTTRSKYSILLFSALSIHLLALCKHY